MGGTYHREGDYLLPDLKAPEAPRIGKYGLLRHQYLHTNKRAILTGLQMSGKLNAHLTKIDREATETEQRLIAQIAASEGVSESLKRRDQMAWVGAMNNICDRVNEIILNEVIFV
ncbi:MAG: TnpV protein [Clostridia bacterium]|nr:TnpV protein [Clostridia bacterium]